MDVLKGLLLVFFSLTLVNCSSSEDEVVERKFRKTGGEFCQDQQVPGEYLVIWKDGRVSVERFESEESFKKEFLVDHADEIEMAEPHYKISVEDTTSVSQRDWGGDVNWGVESIQANELWGKSLVQNEVIVAVIDSGLDVRHPELVEAIAINENEIINGIDDDNNGLVDDRYGYDFVANSGDIVDYTGHGTHVSGVIAAQHDKGQILGVAPNVKVLGLAFISRNGGGLVDGAVRAIRYAAARGAKVINASWGGESCSTLLAQEIGNLALQNILFVAAAGNSGNDLSIFPEYPAGFTISNLITVGASTYDDKTAGFSNYGELVDLVAPGANIVSTYPPEFDTDGNLDGAAGLNGTSMATPFVSASAAYLWSLYPGASFSDIKRVLLEGVVPGPYPVKTRGLLNLPRALEGLNP